MNYSNRITHLNKFLVYWAGFFTNDVLLFVTNDRFCYISPIFVVTNEIIIEYRNIPIHFQLSKGFEIWHKLYNIIFKQKHKYVSVGNLFQFQTLVAPIKNLLEIQGIHLFKGQFTTLTFLSTSCWAMFPKRIQTFHAKSFSLMKNLGRFVKTKRNGKRSLWSIWESG